MDRLVKLPFAPMERRLRLGFVGGGQGAFIGAVHANGARLSNRWDIVAGALSSKPQKAQESGREWYLASDRIYSDYQQMALEEAGREDGIEAVVIVTPNAMHFPMAKAFIEAGIDVICDKPVTITLAEAQALMELQQKHKVFFGVTYTYCGHAMVRQAKAMIKQNMLGEIRQIHVEYFQEWAIDVPDFSAWRLDPEASNGVFTVGDIGTHAFHLAEFVSGKKLNALNACFYITGQPKRVEDTAFMHLQFEDNIPGTLMVSQVAAGAQCGLNIRVFGSKAGLEWQQENPEYLHFKPVDQPVQIYSRGYSGGILEEAKRLVRMPRGHPEALSDAWANLYTEFAIAIDARRNNKPLPEDLIQCPQLSDGLRGMAFIETAVRSNQIKNWVNMVI
ncbi:Gfo/Idh/MocA family oxidoreductase [Bartonella sp. HY329]|uniref:Gfo/Idh/MocA family protein n=1 Tax=unclassified Bartonella TaxID=2645622 RepID=UPI0021C78B59|nr:MULTISPECIES: Gfo/Idh/MocA family oxidoreductase [unclassified Bartonella]UXM94416.1 Gfo/Idh/MocA family oxidoreductase [Bartonella sp. HY329]UXN08740.1 Gfo/Idh/MocA family oxidoreductase [Bartonella sp. HY328]